VPLTESNRKQQKTGRRRLSNAHLVLEGGAQTVPLACLDGPHDVISHLLARGLS